MEVEHHLREHHHRVRKISQNDILEANNTRYGDSRTYKVTKNKQKKEQYWFLNFALWMAKTCTYLEEIISIVFKTSPQYGLPN